MHDLIQPIIFYIFAGLTILSSLLVITQNNPVRCVLFLVLAFFSSAVLWLLAQAEFLGLVLVLVYVGAVMTLFLFVVMMLNIDVESSNTRIWRYLPFGLLLVSLLVALLMIAISPDLFQNPTSVVNSSVAISDAAALGMVLYTDYAFAFELAAIILLVAIVAAITLVHRHSERSKKQNIRDQIMTRKSDRLEMIKMMTEK